jgi:hypothetical protein
VRSLFNLIQLRGQNMENIEQSSTVRVKEKDVVSISAINAFRECFKGTFTAQELAQALVGMEEVFLKALIQGTDCEALIINDGQACWQKGKVKVSFAFTPDELPAMKKVQQSTLALNPAQD